MTGVMISVIICSTNPARLERVRANIEATIGVSHEFVGRDNRGTGDGICRVYNQLAAGAKGEYLCFVHEDVQFLTQGWGGILAGKAAEPKTGIVGLAGAAIKTRALSGMMHQDYGESHVIQGVEGRPVPEGPKFASLSGLDFAPVITVDGLLLFMRREVWEQVRFDDVTFGGFHLYDLDISTATAAAGYTNYVCHTVSLVHYSKGAYTPEWYSESEKYGEKWGERLPMYVDRPDERRVARDERYIFFNITYHLMKRNVLPPAQIAPRINRQLRQYPFLFKSYYQLYRYLRYQIQYKQR